MAEGTIEPFKNETDSLQLGDFTIENRVDRVSFYGSLDITLDKDGLTNVRRLKDVIDRIVETMEASVLPDKVILVSTDTVKNPFA
jgi:hypothetical protein